MEQTLALIASQSKEDLQGLIQQGHVKETENGVKYLVIKNKTQWQHAVESES